MVSDRLAELVADSPSLLAEGTSPLTGPQARVELFEHDIEVVQATEAFLQTSSFPRKERGHRSTEVAPHFGEVPKPAHPDAQSVQPGRARPTTGPPMGAADAGVTAHVFLFEHRGEVGRRSRARG